MKNLTLSFIVTLAFAVVGCKSTNDSTEKEENKEKIQQENTSLNLGFSISECIQHALYYMENTDIQSYDSLDTRYFHEIMGYRLQDAKDLENKILSIKQNISADTLGNIPSFMKDEMQLQIDSLRNQLNYYDKEVIGYVFVHTYTSDSDTLSAIILMNTNCSSSHAIPIKTITDINPDDYVYRVNQINEKEI